MVLRPLDGLRERGRAAGDHADYLAGRGVERRRAFGGVEHAEPAGGAGAGVDQPAAAAQPVGDDLDGARDRLRLRRHGRDDRWRPQRSSGGRTANGVSSSRFVEAGFRASVCR